MQRWVVIDFETASDVDLRKCGAWRYAEDPTTEILCACYETSERPGEMWVWRPSDASYLRLRLLVDDPEVIFVAHNAGFEKAIWRNLMVPHGWPDIPNERWHDSLATCAMRVIPLELGAAARVLGLTQQKDHVGSKLTVGLSKARKDGSYDRSEETLAKVVAYNEQDIRTQVALHRRIGWLPEEERKVWLLDQTINERGIALDIPYIQAARRVVDRAVDPLLRDFAELTGGLKPTQVEKFHAWLDARGTRLGDLRKETLAEVLGYDPDAVEVDSQAGEDEDTKVTLTDETRKALAIRQLVGSASVKKLARMEMCVGSDGRARGLMQYHGAGPGRWAGRLFQPHNFPRGTLKFGEKSPPPEIVIDAIMTGDPDYVQMVLGKPPVECVVHGLRHAIHAEVRRCLVAGDFAGIEARIVLALAGQHDKTALMASGADVYCDMAKDIYQRPVTKSDQEERQIGKNTVLGCGFQMGYRKFRARYCPNRSPEFAKSVIDAYRTVWAPQVPKVWAGLEAAALEAVYHPGRKAEAYGVEYAIYNGWLTATLPSGRKLWYFNPRPCMKAMPWDKNDVRPAWTYQARKMGQWKTIDAFGGLLTENVVQGLARDLLVHAMFKCEAENYAVVLTVHDEIVCEGENVSKNTLEQIMADIPAWACEIKVPVKAEAWEGDRYKK